MISLPAPCVYTWVRVFFPVSKPAEVFSAGLQSKQLGEDIWTGVSLPWVDAASLLAHEVRKHIGILGMLRRHGPVFLTRPTTLEQSCVWGQQQCHGVTEVAAKGVISVQGKMNGGIQVELCLYPFHVFFPVPWSPDWVLLWAGKYGHGLIDTRRRVRSLHRRFHESLSIFAKLGTAELWQAGLLKHKWWKIPLCALLS